MFCVFVIKAQPDVSVLFPEQTNEQNTTSIIDWFGTLREEGEQEGSSGWRIECGVVQTQTANYFSYFSISRRFILCFFFGLGVRRWMAKACQTLTASMCVSTRHLCLFVLSEKATLQIFLLFKRDFNQSKYLLFRVRSWEVIVPSIIRRQKGGLGMLCRKQLRFWNG